MCISSLLIFFLLFRDFAFSAAELSLGNSAKALFC